MVYHILNGDALTNRFAATGLSGEIVITRECLIEGDLSGNTLAAFYKARANYLGATYGEREENYFSQVAGEFDKLAAATSPSEFNLWFGYDLFCAANMWFVIALLQGLHIDKELFVVYPSYLKGNDIWQDFGGATPQQLLSCYNQRISFTEKDLQLAGSLWQAYKNNDLAALSGLSGQQSACFPYLEEVCAAHLDRFPGYEGKSRPERVVAELLEGSEKDFSSVFRAFFQREGVYGFGDVQVKRIYDKVLHSR